MLLLARLGPSVQTVCACGRCLDRGPFLAVLNMVDLEIRVARMDNRALLRNDCLCCVEFWWRRAIRCQIMKL